LACNQYSQFISDARSGRLADAEIRAELFNIRSIAAQDPHSAVPIALNLMIDAVSGSRLNQQDFEFAAGQMQDICAGA